MIKFGYYPAGTRLSERTLADEFAVSRGTIAEAFDELKSAGFLETVPRSGTVVSQNAWERLVGGQTPDWQRFVTSGLQVSNRKTLGDLVDKVERDPVLLTSYGLAEEPFHPYEPLIKAMELLPHVAGYSELMNDMHHSGLPLLRNTLAEYLKKYGIYTSPDNIVVFSGYQEAVNIIHHALLRSGMNYYTMANDMIAAMGNIYTIGANYYPISYDGEGIDPEDFQRKVNRKNMNMLYLNPVNHFPTGITFSHTRRDEILSICQKLRIPVIENDMLRDLWRTEPPPPLKASDEYDQIIYIGTFASMCISGLKLAWAVVPDTISKRIVDVRTQFTGPHTIMNELLANIMLVENLYEESMKNIRAVLPQWIDGLDAILRRHLGGIAEWHKGSINYHAWIKFDERIDTQKLNFDCPDYYAIPGVVYTHGRSSHLLLTALCKPLDVMDKGVQAIAHAVTQQLGHC